jgi:hypothetical protein
MGWMRREWKSLSSLGFVLGLLLGSLGQAQGLLMREIKTFGTHRVAIDLGGQSSATVSILAGDQPGEQLVLGRVRNVWTQDNEPPQRLSPYVMANRVRLSEGQIKRARVEYGATNNVPVVIRGWASQGNIFNRGLLIVTDNWDPNRATFRYELRAQGGLPLWQFLLGFALWFVPGGQIGTFILWGSTGSSGSTTIAIDSTKTIYYKYTGCTAFRDYDGSFTLYASAPAGQAIVLNVQGWCGGGGIGNWARVSQAVAVPSDFHQYSTGRVEYNFVALNRTILKYVLNKASYVRGPDDCGGYYTDRYPWSGGGINFVISGADCDGNMWGAPDKPERSYTSVPSLTLTVEASPGYLANQFGSALGTQPSIPYRYSLSWTRRQFTYQPSAYVSGYAYTTWVSSRLPDGSTVSRRVPQFSMNASTDGMAIVSPNTIGVRPPDLVIPPRNARCTFRNETSDQRFTVYLLDPPGTYSASSVHGGSILPQTSELGPGASASYPPGFYLVTRASTTDFVTPNAGRGLTVRGCSTTSSFYHRDPDGVSGETNISPAFLAY